MDSQETRPLLEGESRIREDFSLTRKRRCLIVLMVIIYFKCLGGSMMQYILNEWIQHTLKVSLMPNISVPLEASGCVHNDTERSRELFKTVQQRSARWIMLNSLAVYVPAFVSSLILSAYTDKCGRKRVIVLSLFGLLISRVVALLVVCTNQRFIFITVGWIIDGLTGSFFTFYSAAFSSIADLMKDSKNRVLAVVAAEFMSMFGTTVSGFLSGLLVESLGFKYTSVICTLCVFIAFILAVSLLPETLNQANISDHSSFLFVLRRPIELYISDEFKGKRLIYSLFLLSFGLAELSGLNRTSLEIIYLLGEPFCWSPKKIGYFISARHLGQAVIGLGTVKLMQQCWSNEVIAVLSTVSGIVSYVVEGLVKTELLIYLVAVISTFSFLTIPMIRGIVSILTPADKQGSMFASFAAIQVLASILAVTCENLIYSATVSVMNGFVFLIMAGVCMVEFVLLVFASVLGRKNSDQQERISNGSTQIHVDGHID